MENKNLMLQAPHSTKYATEKLFSELVELSENDLRLIVGGYAPSEIEDFADIEDFVQSAAFGSDGINPNYPRPKIKIKWPKIKLKIKWWR